MHTNNSQIISPMHIIILDAFDDPSRVCVINHLAGLQHRYLTRTHQEIR